MWSILCAQKYIVEIIVLLFFVLFSKSSAWKKFLSFFTGKKQKGPLKSKNGVKFHTIPTRPPTLNGKPPKWFPSMKQKLLTASPPAKAPPPKATKFVWPPPPGPKLFPIKRGKGRPPGSKTKKLNFTRRWKKKPKYPPTVGPK